MNLDRLASAGQIHPAWPAALRSIAPSIDLTVDRIVTQLSSVEHYLPSEHLVWRAFETAPTEVRVLILGQDPYPDPANAVGLSFSTGPGRTPPASLKNIHEEVRSSGFAVGSDGDLSPWTTQGVMLLNRALTLPTQPFARPRRHLRLWSPIIIPTMKVLATQARTRPVAALLWGAPAHVMAKHLEPHVKVFRSSHPSPRSAERPARDAQPFKGSRPFERVNQWMISQKEAAVDWSL